MTQIIDSALNPDLGHTSSRERPLSNAEQIRRGQAMCAANGNPNEVSCSGNLFIGMFFDGTGNNEQKDYMDVISTPDKQKHSNIVKLYHAHPDKKMVGTNAYYRYYIPGVGTPFPDIGDDGGALGMGAALGGEPRIVWGLTSIFNAVRFIIPVIL